MTIMPKGATQFSSRDFNQKTSEAKKAASQGPVFITDRGEPAYVLMSIEEYGRLAENAAPPNRAAAVKKLTLAEALAPPESADIELEIAPFHFKPRIPDLQ